MKLTKDTAGKPNPYLLNLMEVLRRVSRIREFGNKKYAANTIYTVPPEDLLSAAIRHLLIVVEDNNLNSNDNESGLPHLDHALTNLVAVAEILRRRSLDGKSTIDGSN